MNNLPNGHSAVPPPREGTLREDAQTIIPRKGDISGNGKIYLARKLNILPNGHKDDAQTIISRKGDISGKGKVHFSKGPSKDAEAQMTSSEVVSPRNRANIHFFKNGHIDDAEAQTTFFEVFSPRKGANIYVVQLRGENVATSSSRVLRPRTTGSYKEADEIPWDDEEYKPRHPRPQASSYKRTMLDED